MTPARSTFVDVGGSRRHLLHWGDEDAPVLLLQHGMRDHAHSWAWVAARFATDFHVIAPDLRGHGDSDWSAEGAYALSDYVIDLARIVDAIGSPRFHLVGHSLGGHIAIRYAAAFPDHVRSLCAIEGIELPIVRDQQRSPTPYPVRLRAWIDDAYARNARTPRHYASLADAEARMAGQNPKIAHEVIALLTRHGVIAEAGKGLRWKYDDACRVRAPEDAHGVDLDEVLGAIACPTLLAYGTASWIPVPSGERLARLRGHRLVHFPGASHWLHHQARAPFIAALGDFLSGLNVPSTQARENHA